MGEEETGAHEQAAAPVHVRGNEGLRSKDGNGNGNQRPDATADVRGRRIRLDRMRQLRESGNCEEGEVKCV